MRVCAKLHNFCVDCREAVFSPAMADQAAAATSETDQAGQFDAQLLASAGSSAPVALRTSRGASSKERRETMMRALVAAGKIRKPRRH